MSTDHDDPRNLFESILFGIGAVGVVASIGYLLLYYLGPPPFGPMLREPATPEQTEPIMFYHIAMCALAVTSTSVGLVDLFQRSDGERSIQTSWPALLLVCAFAMLAFRDLVAAELFLNSANEYVPPEGYAGMITVGCWMSTLSACSGLCAGWLAAVRFRLYDQS